MMNDAHPLGIYAGAFVGKIQPLGTQDDAANTKTQRHEDGHEVFLWVGQLTRFRTVAPCSQSKNFFVNSLVTSYLRGCDEKAPTHSYSPNKCPLLARPEGLYFIGRWRAGSPNSGVAGGWEFLIPNSSFFILQIGFGISTNSTSSPWWSEIQRPRARIPKRSVA